MGKAGRPKKNVDPEDVRKLRAIGCSNREIATFCECSVDTLTRNFADILAAGIELSKIGVRRMLWLHGQKGNSVALKYLIHNILKEKLDDGIDVKIFSEEVSKLTDEQLQELAIEKLKLKVDRK